MIPSCGHVTLDTPGIRIEPRRSPQPIGERELIELNDEAVGISKSLRAECLAGACLDRGLVQNPVGS